MTIEKGVAIVGGGPAGLYLSILLRAANSEFEVTVHERNGPQDAYGFGVVFSDETLDNFESADPISHRALVDRFRHWGQIRARHPDGVEIVSGGHGFAAISRRALLQTLTERARELGVHVRFSTEVTRPSDLGSVGVIVGADGANSTVRRDLETDLGFSMVHARNKYVWFGTPKVFDEFNFIFEDTPSGMVWAHIYPYGEEGSTFIVEMRPETWAALGFDKTQDEVFQPGVSDDYALHRCEEIFASHLDGLGLLGNNSRWLQFPTITSESWHHSNVVLMGDAVHTAHFSVGSGTKLAMEDAIALSGLLQADLPLDEAFDLYEEARRPEVESLQRAAKASRDWFEGADRYRDMDPDQFVFSMLTRSQRITYDNLRVHDPAYMAGIDSWYAGSEHSCPVPVDPAAPPMFTLFGSVVSSWPTESWSRQWTNTARSKGCPMNGIWSTWAAEPWAAPGLVMTEMTCVSPEGRISPRCTGLWNREQAAAFARIVDFVHTHTDSRIGLQIGHSGRKGSTKLMWEGDSEPLDEGNWEIMAPSPIRYRPDSQVPREMTRDGYGPRTRPARGCRSIWE